MNHQEKLSEENLAELMEFVLLGFADMPHFRWFIFGLFLIIYIIILMSNGTIFLITKMDPALQSPMYFFLSNFSFLEICYVSATLPKMLMNLGTQRRRISLVACATQMCFVLMFGGTECFLLAVMAYDCYMAICNPLNYPLVMNHRVCIQLVTGSWTIGIPVMIGQTYQVFSLPFCESNQINHFFCDSPPILRLACGDTFVNEMLVNIVAVVFVMVPFLLILGSYSKNISIILKLPSATSQAKAFSTCSSHLMLVVLFFGSGIITYLRPNTRYSKGTDKVLSLFYTILTPMFNPMIYCLRNKDVIMVLRKFLCESFTSLKNELNV
ncbi:olfactory receptor 10AG1-like [Dugong dugon]